MLWAELVTEYTQIIKPLTQQIIYLRFGIIGKEFKEINARLATQ